ncbi:protein SPMIP1 [Urocitellus parryii]
MREVSFSQNQACWQEHIQKETAARVAWNIHYGHKFLKEGTRAKKQPKQAPFRSTPVAGQVPASSSLVSKEVKVGHPQVQGVQNQLIRKARGATQGPAGHSRPENSVMRQAPSSTLKLLFKGVSHSGEGRARYLQERYRQLPEEKFRYPILSSWEYGWHVGDAMKNFTTSPYAKTQTIAKTFYLKSSIFHLPRRTDQLM